MISKIYTAEETEYLMKKIGEVIRNDPEDQLTQMAYLYAVSEFSAKLEEILDKRDMFHFDELPRG